MKPRFYFGCRKLTRFFEIISPMRTINAIVLFPFIIYKAEEKDVPRETILHELVHVEQINRMGWFRFYWTYLKYQRSHGYWKNPLEVEARALAKERYANESSTD